MPSKFREEDVLDQIQTVKVPNSGTGKRKHKGRDSIPALIYFQGKLVHKPTGIEIEGRSLTVRIPRKQVALERGIFYKQLLEQLRQLVSEYYWAIDRAPPPS